MPDLPAVRTVSLPFRFPTAVVLPTEAESVAPRRAAAVRVAWAALLFFVVSPAGAAPGIYTCTDASGRRITSDRPITDCIDREQRQLNRDGSTRAVVGPSLTAQERAQRDAAARAEAQRLSARNDAIRRDRNLLSRFPDEEAHRRAREGALDTVRVAMRATETRMNELAAERKPLLAETEFYRGRSVPAKVRQALDANDASMEALRQSQRAQQAELARINGLYDVELVKLRRLWAGAPPGSVGETPPR